MNLLPKSGDLLVLASYFILWYSLTIVYNVTNKRVLNHIPLPASIATLQLFIGIPLFVIPLFLSGSYSSDSLRWKHFLPYWKIALCHGLGNIATTYSLGAGSVSFTHIIKAAEPVFSAGLSAVILKSYLSLRTLLCLVPIVVGVGMASLTELSFTWVGFGTALLSNLFYQLRNVLAKLELGGSSDSVKAEPPPSPVQLFRAITMLSAILMLPIALASEGYLFEKTFFSLLQSSVNRRELFVNLIASGVSYYLYNEVAFRILNRVSPTTHAVGNTIKRIVIILSSTLFLGTPLTIEGVISSAIAIGGTLLYSLSTAPSSSSSKSKQQIAF
jgi:solute carrier family 35 protein E1